MTNSQNSKSFRESLKVKDIDYSKAHEAAKTQIQSSNPGDHGQRGNQGRTMGGMTR